MAFKHQHRVIREATVSPRESRIKNEVSWDYPWSRVVFLLFGLIVYNARKTREIFDFNRVKDEKNRKISVEDDTKLWLGQILSLSLGDPFKRMFSILLSEQQRRGGLLRGLTFVLSTIPFILIITATSRKKSPFFLLITLLSNFVAITFFITLLELYNSLSNVKEMIWIIKGAPNGAYRFLKVKNLQIILLLSPFSVLFSFMFVFFFPNEQKISFLIGFLVLMLGSIITALELPFLLFHLVPLQN